MTAMPKAPKPGGHLKPQADDMRPVKVAPPKPAAAHKAPPSPQPSRSSNASRPSYDPLAPRLRPPVVQDRQAKDKELKRAKARVSEVEKLIAAKEHAIKDIEQKMAAPGFYDDRAASEGVVTDRQKLVDEVAALMSEWETLSSLAEASR